MTRCCWLAALAMLLGFIAPANAKTPVLQLILTPKTATAAGFGPLVNCFSITPDGIVVVGNESHLWAVGAAGALPLKISGLTSFAFMPGGILLGVDGHQLVYLDTDGTLKTLFSLPEPGMSVVPSQGNTLILFGPEAPGRYGLYLLHQGRQATKILQLPASIEDVAALNKTLLFISGGALYEVSGHHIHLLAAERGAGFTSVTADPITGAIYLADASHVFKLQRGQIDPISNNFTGLLRWTQGGLIIFNNKDDVLVRLCMPS